MTLLQDGCAPSWLGSRLFARKLCCCSAVLAFWGRERRGWWGTNSAASSAPRKGAVRWRPGVRHAGRSGAGERYLLLAPCSCLLLMVGLEEVLKAVAGVVDDVDIRQEHDAEVIGGNPVKARALDH